MRKITIKTTSAAIEELLSEKEVNADYILCSTDQIIIHWKDHNNKHENVLVLDPFKDTTEEGLDAFSFEHAQRIADFITRSVKDHIIVCCDFGESRRPAIAAAILMYFIGGDSIIWENPSYDPNPLVYKKLCKALNLKVSDGEVRWRIKQNEIARKKRARSRM